MSKKKIVGVYRHSLVEWLYAKVLRIFAKHYEEFCSRILFGIYSLKTSLHETLPNRKHINGGTEIDICLFSQNITSNVYFSILNDAASTLCKSEIHVLSMLLIWFCVLKKHTHTSKGKLNTTLVVQATLTHLSSKYEISIKVLLIL